MKRSLLLCALTLLVLAVPTTASACTWVCLGAFGPCVYEVNTSSYCIEEGACRMYYCYEDRAAAPRLLSTKYTIASVEIERRGPADPLESEIRVAALPEAAPTKADSPSLK